MRFLFILFNYFPPGPGVFFSRMRSVKHIAKGVPLNLGSLRV